MADKLVSVNDDYDFPAPVAARQAERLGDATTAEGAALDATFVRRASRMFMLPLADSNQIGSPVARDYNQRTVLRFPKRTTRFWIRIANYNLNSNTALTSPLTFTSIYMGLPTYGTTGTRRWTKTFQTTPTLLAKNVVVPTDGSSVEVGPFTLPAGYEEKEVLFSWGAVAQATGTGVCLSLAGDAYRGGTSSQAGDLTGAATAEIGKIMGDVRFRVEAEGGARVGLFVGTSLSRGYVVDTTAPEGDSRAGILPHETWPQVAATDANFYPVNAAVSGAGLDNFTSGNAFTYQRLDIGGTCDVPDFGVIELGANDLVGANASFEAMQAKLLTAIDVMRSKGVTSVYVATLTPQGFENQQGTITVATSAGATTLTTTIKPNYTGQNVILGAGSDYEAVTVTSSAGTGPYTLTLSAPLGKAHAAGSRIAVDKENIRLRINNWIRQKPYGIAGVVPYDQFVTYQLDQASAIDQYTESDKLHFNRGGHEQIGHKAAPIFARVAIPAPPA